MAQLHLEIRNAGKSPTSYESIETHYDPGKPEVEVASDSLSATPSKPTTEMPKRQNYKPTALRWWFHGCLIICLAAFLGLTEYAIQTLLANNQEDLVSQVWSRSIEGHVGNRQPAPKHEEPSYQQLARVPSNATSSQTGAYSVNTDDFLAIGYSSSTMAAFTDSESPRPENSQTPSSTRLLLSAGEPTEKDSFVPASLSSTTSDYFPIWTGVSNSHIRTTVSTRPSSTTRTVTTTGVDTGGSTTLISLTDAYLNLGTTTSTFYYPTSSVGTGGNPGAGQPTQPAGSRPTSLSQGWETGEGGHQITVPLPSSSSKLTYISGGSLSGDGETTVTITVPFTSEYLHVGTTSLIVTPTPTITTDGGYLSLGAITTTIAHVIDPAAPSATDPKAAGVVSENALSADEKPTVAVIEQTKTWAPIETTIEVSSTDSDGKVAVQHITTTLLGGTSVYQSTKTLSPEVNGEGVTVIRQTQAWPSSKISLERTTTDSGGHVFVETTTTDVPAETSVLETTVTVRPGESLVAVPEMVTTTRGGITQIMQETYIDSEGHKTTSSYTTVIGGEVALATYSYFLATSLPPGYTVITIPTAVPTMEGGRVEVLQTVYTDTRGRLTTSLCTTKVDGIPTSKTIPIVMATPISPGQELVTIPIVISTTVGGTTKVIKTTSTDSRGEPTTFSYTTVEGGMPTSMTVWTIVPTPTSTSPPNSNGTQDTGNVSVIVYGLGLKDYMLGAFLPTVLAAIVSYPFKLININARLMQPFHELATARGADGVSAEASIFLRFYDWTGALSLPRSVKLRQPIIVISDFLVFGAALLAPIAAETVSVHVPDGCNLGCHGSLVVTTIPGRILEFLMATMMALLIALIVLLNAFRWETGVSHNPWGIAGMASLGLSSEMRDTIRKIPSDSGRFVKEKIILKAIAKGKYALDEYWASSSPGSVSTRGYGIVARTTNDDAKKLMKGGNSDQEDKCGPKGAKKKNIQPFALLTWWGRSVLLFIFACVLIIATYYETTSLDSGFERFMDSHGFGVRFFFTALGVVVGGCMETFFRSVAIILPYQQLSKYRLTAERSILLSPPTNAFYGMHSAFRQRSIFLGAVSFTTILAELFLPVTLSHVPFSHLDTYVTQLVCAWLSITILALMILVIFYSFFIQWPHMPVDPRTIAGAMFYVCDSGMLGTLEGISTRGKEERDTLLRSQRLRYEFVSVEGVSGKERMCVDICRETGEAAVMIRGEKARYG